MASRFAASRTGDCLDPTLLNAVRTRGSTIGADAADAGLDDLDLNWKRDFGANLAVVSLSLSVRALIAYLCVRIEEAHLDCLC